MLCLLLSSVLLTAIAAIFAPQKSDYRFDILLRVVGVGGSWVELEGSLELHDIWEDLCGQSQGSFLIPLSPTSSRSTCKAATTETEYITAATRTCTCFHLFFDLRTLHTQVEVQCSLLFDDTAI